MRTLIDLEEKLVRDLDEIARQANVSRAALIRLAVADFLGKNYRQIEADAFGLWGERKTDGLKYQQKLRSEW